jgi:hypothetical protein
VKYRLIDAGLWLGFGDRTLQVEDVKDIEDAEGLERGVNRRTLRAVFGRDLRLQKRRHLWPEGNAWMRYARVSPDAASLVIWAVASSAE